MELENKEETMKEYKVVIYREGALGSLLLGASKVNPERFTAFLISVLQKRSLFSYIRERTTMKIIKNIIIVSIVLITLLISLIFWNIWNNDYVLIQLIVSLVIVNITIFLSYLVKNEFSSEFFLASVFMISLMAIIASVFIFSVWGLLLNVYIWKINLTLIFVLIGTASIVLIIRESNKEKKQKEEGYID